MGDPPTPQPGSVSWVDLTIENAEEIRDFYNAVVGWLPEPVDIGGHQDFSMVPPSSGTSAAGVCYARGVNADLPPQ